MKKYACPFAVPLPCLALMILITILLPFPLPAAQIERISVKHVNGTYHATAEVLLDTSQNHAMEILTDYNRLHRLHAEILESGVVEWRDERTPIVHIKVKTCIFIFCVSTTTQQSFEVNEEEILVTIIPKKGEFLSGSVHWRLLPEGHKTRLSYHSELVPDFWIPPVIGPYAVKAKLRHNTLATFNMLEKIASIRWPTERRPLLNSPR